MRYFKIGCGALLLLAAAPFLYIFVMSFFNNYTGVPTDFSPSALLAEPPPIMEEPVTLRLATFNIQDLLLVARDHEDRMQSIAERLGTLDPDIVGFQEAFVAAHRALLIEGLEKHTRLKYHQYFDSGNMGSGLLISSAYPIAESWFLRYSDSNQWYKLWEGDWWAGKGAGLARIELPQGQGHIDFFDTHAQAGYGNPAYKIVRLNQMTQLGQFIAEARCGAAPAFLVGDLNCGRGSPDYEAVVNGGNLLRLMNINSRIDHVLGVQDPQYEFEVLDTIEIGEEITKNGKTYHLSDHFGYLSEIRITPSAPDESAS